MVTRAPAPAEGCLCKMPRDVDKTSRGVLEVPDGKKQPMKKHTHDLLRAAEIEQLKHIQEELDLIKVDDEWRSAIKANQNLPPVDKLTANSKALDSLCQRLGIPEEKIIHRFTISQRLIEQMRSSEEPENGEPA